jgi:hypothetical protein
MDSCVFLKLKMSLSSVYFVVELLGNLSLIYPLFLNIQGSVQPLQITGCSCSRSKIKVSALLAPIRLAARQDGVNP